MNLKEFVKNNIISNGDSLVINGLIEYNCKSMDMDLHDGRLEFYDPNLVKSIYIDDIEQIEIIKRNSIGDIIDSVLYTKDTYENFKIINTTIESEIKILTSEEEAEKEANKYGFRFFRDYDEGKFFIL